MSTKPQQIKKNNVKRYEEWGHPFYKVTKEFIVYKKVLLNCRGVIIKLIIPKGAIIRLIPRDKCRSNIAITLPDQKRTYYSAYDYNFYYPPNCTIIPNSFSKLNKDCGEGIHFFLTRQEARDYDFL